MRLRSGFTNSDFRNVVQNLEIQVDNFASWSAGPDKDPLRNVYLRWVSDAERDLRRVLLDVPADQFGTSRWNGVMNRAIPAERLYSVVDGDAKAQLDWMKTALEDLERTESGGPNIEPDDIWQAGMIRAFVSHLSEHKIFAAEVAGHLLGSGLHGFVAHENIEVSAEWQIVIERALNSAHVFLGLVHPGFSASHWTQQEVGWAMARGIPALFVRLGEDPKGFPAKFQYPTFVDRPAADVAESVVRWLSRDSVFVPILAAHGVSVALR